MLLKPGRLNGDANRVDADSDDLSSKTGKRKARLRIVNTDIAPTLAQRQESPAFKRSTENVPHPANENGLSHLAIPALPGLEKNRQT